MLADILCLELYCEIDAYDRREGTSASGGDVRVRYGLAELLGAHLGAEHQEGDGPIIFHDAGRGALGALKRHLGHVFDDGSILLLRSGANAWVQLPRNSCLMRSKAYEKKSEGHKDHSAPTSSFSVGKRSILSARKGGIRYGKTDLRSRRSYS